MILVLFLFWLIFTGVWLVGEKYVNYLNHKSKCFSCEKEMIQRVGKNGAWMANPAKSFDAEREAVSKNGLEGGFLAKTIKYY